MKYQTKTTLVDAVEFTGELTEEILALQKNSPCEILWDKDAHALSVVTLEGTKHADKGDFLVKDAACSIDLLKPFGFNALYTQLYTAGPITGFVHGKKPSK